VLIVLHASAMNCVVGESDEDDDEEDEADLSAARSQALKEAIKEGNVEMVSDLLEEGADIQHAYAQGLTPLHLAVVHEKLDIVRLLVQSRADPLAKTTDDVAMTPLDIANMEGQQDIFNALCEEALPHPFWRRFAGPLCLLLIIAGNGVIFLYLNETDLAFQTSAVYRNSIVVLATACIVGLMFANFLDPGTVGSEEVAYVQELRRLPSIEVTLSRTPAEDETFRLLTDEKKDDDTGHAEDSTYRWCRTCRFWRPPGVSHCAMCGKCFWRMDHHCWAIGNCVALHNHRFFSAMVTTGAAAWALAAIAVALGLAEEAHALLQKPTLPMLVALAFIVWSMLALSVLIPFAGFHMLALLCNVTSKSTCGRRPQWNSRRLNRCSEYRQIFCSPVELRPCEGLDDSRRRVHLI